MSSILDFLDENSINYRLDEPMKLHTTFRIGGNAKIFAEVQSMSQLSKLVSACQKRNMQYMILGNGSNLLVSDNGIDKIVITLKGDFCKISSANEITIEAGAGESLASVCKFALVHGLTGLEFAYGIPGSVGGALYMNAGAYGGQMSDVVSQVKHVDADGKPGSIDEENLNFGYRKSAYSTNGCIITSVLFKLKKGNKQEISEKMTDLLSRRKAKQPLEYPSAGSVFKRPEGYFAGALIEQSGLKGKSIGGAQVSEKHAGFIINKDGATCKDVKDLIKFCQKTVFEKFSVNLETEIKMI